jgi:ribosomal protein L31
MKTDIHPEYHETTIQCACGNVVEVGSTKEGIPASNASAKNMKNFNKKKKNRISNPRLQ